MTVSTEVSAALSLSGLPIEAEACLGALAEGEGGRSFLSLYGDSAGHPNLWSGSLDHFPSAAEWPGGTGPTGDPTSALGFLQFERATYAECTAATGLAGIDPQSQIANGWWLAQHDYTKRTGGGLLAALHADRLDEVATALVFTWPGGANPEPNHKTGFPGFPAAYTAFLATLPASGPIPTPPPPPPTPPPPAADPVDTALASMDAAVGEMSTDIGLVLAKLAASHPDPQSIVTRIDEITAQLRALSASIKKAIA
jgi:hypothetical protein